MIESTRAAYGTCGIDRCEICQEHGPGVASDLLRGGLGGPGLGLDVLAELARLGQVEDGGGREAVLKA